MADATAEIEHLRSDIADHKGRLDEHEGLLDTHSSELQRVTRWALDGNGECAQTRIKNVEGDMVEIRKCVEKVASDESIAKIAAVAVKEVIGNARTRDKTMIAKLRAFAPYFAAFCALVAGIIAVVVK
jgi:predicted  nucleic acid-binding Zn-ribbon protein